MATLTTVYPLDTGVYPAPVPLAEVANTVEVGNGRNSVLILENTNASTRTVTILVSGNTPYGQPWPSAVYTLAALTGRLMIPLRTEYIDPAVPSRATFTLSAFAGVSAAVVRNG